VGGAGEHDVAVLFVEEVPGLFVPRDTQPSHEAREVLADATAWLNARGFTAVPIWRLAHEAGEAIVQVALELGVNAVLVGTSQRGTLWRFLRGNVLARLIARAPREVRILIVAERGSCALDPRGSVTDPAPGSQKPSPCSICSAPRRPAEWSGGSGRGSTSCSS
jgi:hypothetical protein